MAVVVSLVSLPDAFEIHEWAIMERFSSRKASAAHRDELLDSIHGAGAFRSFRRAIRRLGIEDDWFRLPPERSRRARRSVRSCATRRAARPSSRGAPARA
jgi:hypothetical protein